MKWTQGLPDSPPSELLLMAPHHLGSRSGNKDSEAETRMSLIVRDADLNVMLLGYARPCL